MKTILVTGSNGFIGKYIKVFNNFSGFNIIYGTTSNIELDNSYTFFDKLYNNISNVLNNKKIDIIIHCASVIPDSFDLSDQELLFKNMKMMSNLYDFSIDNKIDKFIYLSSFGSMEDTRNYDIKDYYTLSKICGEHMCSMMEFKGIQTASLRISSPFGEFYNKNNVLSLFIDLALKNKPINIYGSGKREQNFIYAGNILNYVECCIKNDILGIYDVVSYENISMNELANRIIYLTNSNSTIQQGEFEDPLENVKLPVYNLKRSENISYIETYDFEKSLKKYIEYRKRELEK